MPTDSASRSLPGALVRFGALLRRQGLPLTPLQVTDATRALEHLDLSDRAEVYLGLRAVLVGRPEDVPVFDRCFASFWRADADADEVARALAGPEVPSEHVPPGDTADGA